MRLKNRGNANYEGLTKIAKARMNKGLSIADVCRFTGLSYDNYIKYERGKAKEQYMCIDTLVKLSQMLGVDLLSEYHYFKLNSAQIVREYMSKYNLTISKFAEMCGVSTTAVKQWRNGTCSPSYDKWLNIFK